MLKNIAIAFILFLVHPMAVLGLDDPSTREEVGEFFDSYLGAFAARDENLLSEQYLIAPIYLRTGNEILLLESKESVIAHLSTVFSDLSIQNYSRTEIATKSTCVLTDDAVIVSVVLRRYSSEGVVLLESGASYSIVKLGGSWRVTMASVHTPEKVVSCET
ncbi:MAG: hypothetical protein V7708_04620 [Oceanicoccus sp.]